MQRFLVRNSLATAVTFLAASALSLALQDPPPAESSPRRQIGQLVLDGIPEWSDSARERMLQYLGVRPHALRGLAEDGSALVIGTRFGNATQLHLLTQPMGARRQITFSDEPIGGGAIIPGTGGRRILFSKDKGGDERAQIYILDLDSGKARLLTDGKSRNTGVSLSRSGRLMAFSSTQRNDRDFDVYLLDMAAAAQRPADDGASGAAPQPKLIWQVQGQYYAGEFSPDETKLLVVHYLSERETHWFVHDLASGQNTRLTPETPPMYYGSAAWDAEGKSVYLTSDREGEFRKLYRLEPGTDRWQCLTADIAWDVDDVAVDPAGKGIAFVVNQDGLSQVYFANADGSGRRPVTAIPPGVVGGLSFARKGGVIGLTLNTSQTPSDVYTLTYPQGKLTRWTEAEVGGLNPETFVAPTLIRYETFDKAADGTPRRIPALYYKPRGKGPHPVVIYTHGGPEGQTQPTFSSIFQYWVNELGIAVIAPNVRGSTGYGRSFHQLDNDVKRLDSVRDIGALLDWIGKQPELDAKRVGVFGGSYGGYMVLASLVNYPERFKAGIDIVGIASLVTFLENTPEYRRDLRREEYGDERKPDVRKELEAASPLNHADKIKASLFVVHGKNDSRVPYTEAEQIVAKTRSLGRPTWYALALNEGHGFAKRDNSDLAAILYALFWEKHLLN